MLIALVAGCSAGAHDDAFVRAFRTLRPSVVLFTMHVPTDDAKRRGQYDEVYGTGIVVASGAWGSQILTVAHVIDDARDLRVTIREKTVVPARVVVRDDKDDLAIVETSAPNLVAAQLGESSGLEPGMSVGVAGYPIPDAFDDEGLGIATSLYVGRISSVRKDALELDVPIIPGESGGPVFDPYSGTVVGLVQSRFDEERAIGFAIPIDDAKKFLKGKLHGG
jgi:serine protease Do